ncbi:MAG: type III-D CRISPR-associated protein Csx19 [Candidatus Cryosericum sp.]
MMGNVLMSARREDVPVDVAMKEVAGIFGGEATVLVYGPSDCVFGRVGVNGELSFSPGHPWPEGEPVFEMRVFSPSAEFRWLHQAEGRGPAVVLTEVESVLTRLPAGWSEPSRLRSAVSSKDICYLLWGTGTGDEIGQGWSRLAEPRIGAIDIPIAGMAAHHHASLRAREYDIADDGKDGNVEVAEERLLELVAGEVKYE